MIIKNYSKILFDLLKSLIDQDIHIYENTMPEDEDSQPLDFIVYRAGVTNSARLYGDGKTLLRQCECDIIVNEYGTGNYDNSGTLADKVEQILIDADLSYTRYFLGVDQKTNSVQTTFSFYL